MDLVLLNALWFGGVLWGVGKEHYEDEDVDEGSDGDYKNEEDFFCRRQVVERHHVDLVNLQLNICLSMLYEVEGLMAMSCAVQCGGNCFS